MLAAGAAVELALEKHRFGRIGFWAPGAEKLGKRRPENRDDRRFRARRQMHRAAVGAEENGGPGDELADFDEIEPAAEREKSRRGQAGGDPALPQAVSFAADRGDSQARNFKKARGQGGMVFLAPIPEGVSGADVKNGNREGDSGGQGFDPGLFLRPDLRKNERRDFGFCEVRSKRPDKPGVGFNRMEGNVLPPPGRGSVVKKALGFYGVADFQPGAGKQRDPRCPRASVEIEEGVKPRFPNLPDEPEKIPAVLLAGDDDDPVDVGIPFDQAAERLLNEIDRRRFRETALEERNGRGRQNNVAEAAEAEKKDGAGDQINF